MTDLPSLPVWAKTLQRRIRQRGIDCFILHGPGVRDLHPLGARRFGTIGDCLAQAILNDRSAIVTYDRGAGIGFSDRDVENDFKTVLEAYGKLGGTNLAQVQTRDPDRALQVIETYLRYQLTGNPRFSAAVIIDYGETVAPAGEPGQLPAEDRGAILTAGLTRLHLESLLAEAEAGGAPLDQDALTREKKRLIEEASGGLLTFMTSRVGLDAVAGHEGARAVAGAARRRADGHRQELHRPMLREGDRDPGGRALELSLQVAGANRSEPGARSGAARRDRSGRGGGGRGGRRARNPRNRRSGFRGSERVFASLAAFMGDTRRRGKVIWFLMTSRPDLVPVDLKRQGRAEEHLALFPPATIAERVKVFDLLRERLGIALEPGVDAAALFAESRDALSAADLEAILVRSSRRMASAGRTTLSAALLRELIRDFQPPSYPLELEYQRLIAAFECTSRQLLPPDLAAVPPEAIGARLAELRAALGKSA